MNVVYRSAENSNPGDTLSYIGTRKVLFEHIGVHNQFFYDIMSITYRWTREQIKGNNYIRADLWHEKRNVELDLIVIAGTPSWRRKNTCLWTHSVEHHTPILFVGVGTVSGSGVTKPLLTPHPFWKYCIGFIARDRGALSTATNMGCTNGTIICCPSIFAYDVLKNLGTKTGIIFQADIQAVQQFEMIERMMKTDDVLLITHEIVDYEVLVKKLPQYYDKIVYSRNLDMLIRFYSMCNKIYSMRLHGTHFAFALGISTVCMKTTHNKSRACREISVKVIKPGIVDESHLISREKIIKIKKEKWIEYYNYLSKINWS